MPETQFRLASHPERNHPVRPFRSCTVTSAGKKTIEKAQQGVIQALESEFLDLIFIAELAHYLHESLDPFFSASQQKKKSNED